MMLSKKISKQKRLRATALLFFVCLLSSCATSRSDIDSSAVTGDDATNDSAVSTAVSDETLFSDIEAPKENSATLPSDSGAPYYNSLGGESLKRVAHTLFENKAYVKMLVEKNPDLKGVKKLSTDQRVYFDFEKVRPSPTYLTKDLLDRYADPLSERMASRLTEATKTAVVVGAGESLQAVSQRLYGTTRYWPEIYLLNRDKIANYDKVRVGASLMVAQHDAVIPEMNKDPLAAASISANAPIMPMAAAPAPKMDPLASQPEPVTSQPPTPTPTPAPVAAAPIPSPAPAVVDPIPETPPPPAVVVAEQKVSAPPAPQPESAMSNPNLRRGLYVGLVLLIMVVAFYMTKPAKKRFDILDTNPTDTISGRMKLGSKDSHDQDVG